MLQNWKNCRVRASEFSKTFSNIRIWNTKKQKSLQKTLHSAVRTVTDWDAS